MISTAAKQTINNVIFERAYIFEERLSEDNFFLAKLCGLRPDQISDASLKMAVKEIKKEFNK